MGVETAVYKDQSAADLRLNLIEGDLDLRQFTVLRAGSLVHPRLQVHAGIIGASHAVRFQVGGRTRLHEVFACVGIIAEAAETQSRLSVPLAHFTGPLELRLGGQLSYCFQPWVTDVQTGQVCLQRLEDRIARVASGLCHEIGLRYDFPRRSRLGSAPKTLVWTTLAPSGCAVQIETAHSYPHEHTVVFSRTRIELDPDGEACQ